ncbi:MAG: S1 family peptidase, partial [Silvanigrellaceae bacterium]|nr:S1 family peptidase [Silvanigrellaceae bacterium]
MTGQEIALFHAVIHGNPAEVAASLNTHLNINIRDEYGFSAIVHAILAINAEDPYCPNLRIAKMLRAKGAVLPESMLFLESRDILEFQFRNNQRDFDNYLLSLAKNAFENLSQLEIVIQEEIFPSLVTIRTDNGLRAGTGFFYHPNWLVSNAHVLPSKQNLEEGNTTIEAYLSEETLTLKAQSSFHRPNNFTSPDIALVKTQSANNSCLSHYVFSEMASYSKKYLFYVEPNLNSYEGFLIQYLQQISQEGDYPIRYQCLDGSRPHPGASGSPIIEARITISKKPQWEFRVVGTLYARDHDSLYAIPIAPEFLEILDH